MRFKLVEDLDNSLNEISKHGKKFYYHGNNSKFKVGDKVIEDSNLKPIVRSIYNRYLTPLDADTCVYMLDHFSDEYKDAYEHYYIVEATNVKKCLMDYSAWLCSNDLLRFKPKDKSEEEFIETCAKAYVGLLSREELEKFSKDITYSEISLKPEWISNDVKVIKVLK